MIPRLGNNVETITLDKDEAVVLHNPHERMDEEYLFEDATILTFGYTEVPDWNKVTLIKSAKPKAEAREAVIPTPQEGDIIEQARVIKHLVQGAHQGIVFRLDAKNEGIYWRDQMSIMEWDNKDMLMPVNSAHDVEVTSSRFDKAKKRWKIKVKTLE